MFLYLSLVREIEKKFSDKHVLIVADRKIVSKTARTTQKRPRSRTLTAVHECLLNELVYPSEIVAKRTRVNVDGKRCVAFTFSEKSE